MFTGIIEEVGKVRALNTMAQGGQITVSANQITQDVKLGDSIAINGVCLTIIEFSRQELCFDISGETLSRTTLGSLRSGSSVNLERALRPSDRMGGHIVQGHVDTTGRFLSRTPVGESVNLRFQYPAEIARYICLKGSIAVEGVSLTVSALGEDWFEVAAIPHTLKVTTLEMLRSGEKVNLEADVIAKYLERLLQFKNSNSSSLTMDDLRNLGY